MIELKPYMVNPNAVAAVQREAATQKARGEWTYAQGMRRALDLLGLPCGDASASAHPPPPAVTLAETYQCRCVDCGSLFYGGKRDVVCPTCRVPAPAAAPAAPKTHTITVMRNGRPATQEELEAAVRGDPLPPEPAAPKLVRCEHAVSGACKRAFCAEHKPHTPGVVCQGAACMYSPTGRARCGEVAP